jgi:hypothetical protein
MRPDKLEWNEMDQIEGYCIAAALDCGMTTMDIKYLVDGLHHAYKQRTPEEAVRLTRIFEGVF